MKRWKLIGTFLLIGGGALIFASIEISHTEQREANEKLQAEIYRTLSQGTGTGSGTNVQGESNTVTGLRLGGLLMVGAGIVSIRGKLGRWEFDKKRVSTNSGQGLGKGIRTGEFCTQCGARKSIADIFCKECGARCA